MAYLIGSIPFGYILVRVFRGQDIRKTGSGNIGATNVARSGAKVLGLWTLVLDAGKGALAVFVGIHLARYAWVQHEDFGGLVYPGVSLGAALAATMAVVGHMFPVWLRFRGGKGVATAAGAFIVISPAAFGLAVAIFLVVVAISRFVSLGSIIAALAFPFLFWFLERPLAAYAACLLAGVTSALIILKHHANIRRLLAGTESRLGAKRVPPGPTEKPA